MRKAFVGFGELGTQLFRFLQDAEFFEDFVIFDDLRFSAGDPKAFKFHRYMDEEFADCRFYVGLGYRMLKEKQVAMRSLLEAGREVPSFVHRTSYVAPTAKIGQGTFVYPNCTVDKEVELEAGVLLNNSVTVCHESRVGFCSYISPGVIISGNTTIGERSFLGTGCLLSNGLSLGDGVIVGIGSVVTQNLSNGVSCIGNPLQILKNPLQLK
jgi:sugar O-acyltransferase (sialic acid O-acetyltransferase NeuD family)